MPDTVDYDVIIVGSGAAGMAAALRASELGASAALVEGAEVIGGTCVNVGCIPSKNLIEAAHQYHTARTGFPGVVPCEPELVWRDVLRQKRQLIQRLRQEKYVDVISDVPGLSLLRGRASLHDGGRVRVGDRELRADRIIVATGTRPAMPPIQGLDQTAALDSTTAMELEQLPENLIVIGAGAVGLELGQAFSRFGVHVTVVEAMERIVPMEDVGMSGALAEALQQEGMEFQTAATVTRVARAAGGYRVFIRRAGASREFHAEQLLVATGRRPNTEQLGLGAAGVRTDGRGFIETDAYMRTSNPAVFAACDVTGGPEFVYVAAAQGALAAQVALAGIVDAQSAAADLETVPRITFTDPQLAAVGLTEEAARAAGIPVKVTAMPVEHVPRALVSYRTRGVIKLVADAETDRLLGVHAVSANAGDFIAEAVLAIRFGLRVQDLVSALHPYLTWGEGLKLAAQTFTKDVRKLSCCA